MPKLALTELAVQRLRTEAQTDFWDTHLSGLAIRVGPRAKTWVLKHQNRRQTLGRWPQMTLKEARDEARRRVTQKHATPPEITFPQARELYLELHGKNLRRSTLIETTRLLKPVPFKGRIADVTADEVIRYLRALSPSEANHCFYYLRALFNWCVPRKYLVHSPLQGIGKPHRTVSRDRVLSDDEICRIWRATERTSRFHTIVRLCLLTGQRRGEISQLKPEWIDGDEIRFPASVTKNGAQHRVPLTPFTLQLARAHSGPFNGWSKAKAQLDRDSSVANWTLHDLRRTWASLAARWDIQEHLAARIQNHRTAMHANPIRSIYQRYEFQAELRSAMELFQTNLAMLLNDDELLSQSSLAIPKKPY